VTEPRSDREDGDGLVFDQLVLNLLDEGRRTATYKLAVLLALVDCCTVGTDATGRAPERVSTSDLARRVLELYWPQVRAYTLPTGEAIVLRQSSQRRALTVEAVEHLRHRARAAGATTPAAAERLLPREFARAVDTVELNLLRKSGLGKLRRLLGYSETAGRETRRSSTMTAPFATEGPLLPRAAAVIGIVVGVLAAATAATLFALPTRTSSWPWSVTPLTARVMAAIFSLGIAGLTGFAGRRWKQARILFQVGAMMLVLIGCATVHPRGVRHRRADDVDPGERIFSHGRRDGVALSPHGAAFSGHQISVITAAPWPGRPSLGRVSKVDNGRGSRPVHAPVGGRSRMPMNRACEAGRHGFEW
jgi:hypothetical protein